MDGQLSKREGGRSFFDVAQDERVIERCVLKIPFVVSLAQGILSNH